MDLKEFKELTKDLPDGTQILVKQIASVNGIASIELKMHKTLFLSGLDQPEKSPVTKMKHEIVIELFK